MLNNFLRDLLLNSLILLGPLQSSDQMDERILGWLVHKLFSFFCREQWSASVTDGQMSLVDDYHWLVIPDDKEVKQMGVICGERRG